MTVAISNPPYNMKWQHPFFAASQSRFALGIPPESNANWAFVLTALDKVDKTIFLLPKQVLSSGTKAEKAIIRLLIETSMLVAVIELPGKMFESTDIATCLLVFDKSHKKSDVLMIDLTDKCDQKVRLQNGQFGKNNTKKTYKKKFNVLSNDTINKVCELLKCPKSEQGLSQVASLEDIRENDYLLTPRIYIKSKVTKPKRRDYADIVNDLNHIIKLKNQIKITINKKAAKDLGVYDQMELFRQSQKTNKEMVKMIKDDKGLDLNKENFITLSKDKVLKMEVQDWDRIPLIFQSVVRDWAQMIYILNLEENRYLNEYKEALLDEYFG